MPSSPTILGGYHVIFDNQTKNRTRLRARLRAAVDNLFKRQNWQTLKTPNGKRLCAGANGEPVPPISISYSGPMAIVAISPDWRNIGVDIEVTPKARVNKYSCIEAGYVSWSSPDPMATFVRAEAWAKALDYGFAFGPSFFLRGSANAGERDGGKRVDDIDLNCMAGLIDLDGQRIHASVCVDIAAAPMALHSFVRIE
jgi:hypothetical protein